MAGIMDFITVNANKAEDFRKLLSDLSQGAGFSSQVSVSDADEDQIKRLGEALQATEQSIAVIRLDGGCFCRRETDESVVDGLCDFIEHSSTSLRKLTLVSNDPESVCHEIPLRLISAFAENINDSLQLELEGFNLARLSEGMASLMLGGKLMSLELKNMLEVDEVEVITLQEALGTESEGFKTLVLQNETPPQFFRSLMLGFAGNPTLRQLKFDHLEEENAAPFCRLLANCPRLSKVDFRRLPEVSVSLMEALAATFEGGSSPTTLDFSSCSLTAKHVPALRELISKMRNLKILKLAGNELGLDGFRDLCMGLNDNETIEKVHLGDNGITGEAVWGLLSGLFMYNHTIKDIHLNNNDLSGCTKETWEALSRNQTLETIDLRNSLQDSGAWVRICNAFQADSYSIKLEWISAESENTHMLLIEITKCVEERELQRRVLIEGKSKPGEQYLCLSEVLRDKACSIHTLQLPFDFCESHHWDALLDLIVDSGSLRTLRLCPSANAMSTADTAVKSLCRTLPSAQHLRSLKMVLDENLDTETRASLQAALKMNRSLFWAEMALNTGDSLDIPLDVCGLRNRIDSLHDIPMALLPHIMVQKGSAAEISRDWPASKHRLHATFFALKLFAAKRNSPKTKRKRGKCRIHIHVGKKTCREEENGHCCPDKEHCIENQEAPGAKLDNICT